MRSHSSATRRSTSRAAAAGGRRSRRRGARSRKGSATRSTRRGRPSSAALLKVLALDYGSARTGVAVSDPTGTVARPLVHGRAGRRRSRSARSSREEAADRVVVGLPLTLRGEHGEQAEETERVRRGASRRASTSRSRRSTSVSPRPRRSRARGRRPRGGPPALELPGVVEPPELRRPTRQQVVRRRSRRARPGGGGRGSRRVRRLRGGPPQPLGGAAADDGRAAEDPQGALSRRVHARRDGGARRLCKPARSRRPTTCE